ncbi:MAG: ribosome maturation factor RimP [Acidobacteria bacterium]|nr:ribosome maturation factor RimP [Acidobacteriota bacterium]
MKQQILAKVTEIAEQAGAAEGLEIVEIELLGGGAQRVLRIFIDKPDGVTHGDCENISHAVGAALDAQDVIPEGRYTLEVSSPGVDRRLSKPRDFERFVGQKIKVALRQPVDGARRLEGRLEAFAEEVITLVPDKGDPVRIPLGEIEKANLKFEW